MTDMNVSSFSSGGSAPLPKGTQQKKQQQSGDGLPSQKEGQDAVGTGIPSEGPDILKEDTLSTATGTSQGYEWGQAPSIMAYIEGVDLPRYKMSAQLYEGIISDHDLAKQASMAAVSLASVTVTDNESIDELSQDMQDLYDFESTVINGKNGNGGVNAAINKFNQEVKKAATQKKIEPSGLTLLQATQQMNQQIKAYQKGDITEDEFDQDVDEYNSYLAAWNDAMSGPINDVNKAIDEYNKGVEDFNEKVDEINTQLTAYGCTYQMPEMEPLPNIPSTGIPPISYDINTTIKKPKPVGQIEVPPPPPDTETLEGQMANPPQSSVSGTSSWGVVTQNMNMFSDNSEYQADLLKKFNKAPLATIGIEEQTYLNSYNDLQPTPTSVIKDLFLKINLEMMNSKQAAQLDGDGSFIKEVEKKTNQLIADSVMNAVSNTEKMLKGKNPSKETVNKVFGVNLAMGLYQDVKSGRVKNEMENLINSHENAMKLPQEYQQKLVEALQLSFIFSAINFVSTPFDFKGLIEQVFGKSVEATKKQEFNRAPTSFNHILQNSFATFPVIQMTEKTLAENHNYSPKERDGIAHRTVEKTKKQLPFPSKKDLTNALVANFREAGVSNPEMAKRLADDITNTLAAFMPFAPAFDTAVPSPRLSHEELEQLFDDPNIIEALESDPENSGLTELTPSKVGAFQAELESYSDPETAKAQMQGLATNPLAVNDTTLPRTLHHASEVSSRIEGGASPEQLQQLGLNDPAFIESVQSSQPPRLNEQQVSERVIQHVLTSGMKMGPISARNVAARVSLGDVVNVDSVVQQLSSEMKKHGYPPELAEKAVKQASTIPTAYDTATTFKNTLAAFLPPELKGSVDQLDLSGVINKESLNSQIDAALVAEGFGEKARADVLASVSSNLPLTDRTPADEIAGQLVASTGMSHEQAYLVAKRLEDPQSYIDISRIGDVLAEHGFDNNTTQPVLNQMLYLGGAYISMGKLAEMINAQFGVTLPPETIETFYRRDRVEEEIISAVGGSGLSDEQVDAVASRGSSELFKVRTQVGERV